MVRSTSGLRSEQADAEAQKIEVALNAAEDLIRRKRAFGTELGELWRLLQRMLGSDVLYR